MSRSYKKYPLITDESKSKRKREANRLYRRRTKDIDYAVPKTYFKRVTESYNIADYKDQMSQKEAIDFYNAPEGMTWRKRFDSLETWLKYWKKTYVRK